MTVTRVCGLGIVLMLSAIRMMGMPKKLRS